jgi:hypothetical protein
MNILLFSPFVSDFSKSKHDLEIYMFQNSLITTLAGFQNDLKNNLKQFS